MFKRLAVLLIGALLLFGLSACDSVKSMTSNLTVGKVIEEFKAAGLEADNPSDLPGVTISFWENCTFRHILDTNQPIPCTLRNRLLMLNSK
ncbi:hypothetical protein DX931_28480 [Bacillus cereus]|nr:hypothetical protein DX931_28480 [Bacillus cereus]